DRLLNAIAARNIAFNLARIIGGVLTGALIAAVDMSGTYLAVSAAFLLCVVFLPMVGRSAPAGQTQKDSILRNLVAGLGYAYRDHPIRVLLLLSVLVEAFAFSLQVLLPVFIREVLY